MKNWSKSVKICAGVILVRNRKERVVRTGMEVDWPGLGEGKDMYCTQRSGEDNNILLFIIQDHIFYSKSSTQCFTMNYVTQIMRSGFKIYLDLDVQMLKGENLLHLHSTFFCFPFVSDWPLAAIQPGPREAGQLFLWPIVAATFLNPPIVAATM